MAGLCKALWAFPAPCTAQPAHPAQHISLLGAQEQNVTLKTTEEQFNYSFVTATPVYLLLLILFSQKPECKIVSCLPILCPMKKF